MSITLSRKPAATLKSLGHPSVKATTRKAVRQKVLAIVRESKPEYQGKGLGSMPARLVVAAYEQVGYRAPYRFLEKLGKVERYHA